jgi:hypothetical protein
MKKLNWMAEGAAARDQVVCLSVAGAFLVGALVLAGCTALDSAYQEEVVWSDVPGASVAMTNLAPRPEAEAAIAATGSVVNTYLPGIGSIVALALGGLYHGYRQIRNRKVNEALVQGVETARAILETTPQGQQADAAFVKWLMTHQKEAGVFNTVAGLVDDVSDSAAAKLVAEEIGKRVRVVVPAGAN